MPEIEDSIEQLMEMRRFVDSGATSAYEFRRHHLEELRDVIVKYEEELFQALAQDLGKSREEAYATEVGMVLGEIRITLKNLRRWSATQPVRTNLLNFPSSSRIIRDPLGVVLIVAPWNYPVQLLLLPLVGAIAGGNVILLKPSEMAPACARVVKKIVDEAFCRAHVSVVCGDGAIIIPPLLHAFRFDHIFFTGSPGVGKIIYELAAKKLVPVTLELGGKNPAVVEHDADIATTAKRIVLGKFINAGQTCAAPDYLLVHADVRAALIKELKVCIERFFGTDPAESRSYGRIINNQRFDRLVRFLREGNILHGGDHSSQDRYIAPTLMDGVPSDSCLLREEIFGPILPVFTFTDMYEAQELIARNPSPLSFYLFTKSAALERLWIDSVRFGGGCVNNTLWQLSNHHLPFGGIGTSGMGAYHGKHSFGLFTHAKPVMKTPLWFDPGIKYPPFAGKLKWFRKMIR
jgi:aldehyde dehydrogenase (NAD+)